MTPRSRNLRWRGAAVALAAIAGCGLARAQIRTDGTLGPALALAGPNFLIGEALGRLSGANLFHSFQTFNVGAAESATFVTTTPGLANVVSRVTGGTPSQIAGLLRLASTDAAPNFFFINPAGVTFSGNAAIDVPAAFHVGTADYLKFPDGNFYADASRASTLSVAPPEAFGFLGTGRATVAIRDGALLRTASEGTDQPIGIAGGDVIIDNGFVATGGSAIRVVAAGDGAREVALAGALPDARGNLAVVNGGYVASFSTGDSPAGDVAIATGSLTIADGGVIGTAATSAGAAGAVTVTARDVAIDGANRATGRTGILSLNFNGGTGNLIVTAERGLSIAGGGEISADTLGSGRGGDVVVAVPGALTVTGGSINSRAGATGDAGSVHVTAGTLTVTQFGAIDASTFASGRAGTVEVTADSVMLSTGGAIRSDTRASGSAGSVSVSARELSIDGKGGEFDTGISSGADLGSTGDAGAVVVHVAGTLLLANRGTINSNTFGPGSGGAVEVTAGAVQMRTGSAIASDTYGAGNGGSIAVAARVIEIIGGGGDLITEISSLGAFSATGNAGDVRVTATDTLTLANGGAITSNTYGDGNAGTVAVSGDRIVLTTGGRIGSDTFFGGNAGTVAVTARELTVGDADFLLSRISSDSFSAVGRAGDVRIDVAGTLTLANGGLISSDAASAGRAGTVNVAARNLRIDGGGVALTGISSDSGFDASGAAGDIRVAVGETLTIVNLGRISSDTFNTGDAGKVAVSADSIAIASGGSISSETFGAGSAGSVAVAARTLAIEGDGGSAFTGIATRSTSIGTGNAGSVAIEVGDTLSIANVGAISSGTAGGGRGGSVSVDAGRIALDTGATIGAAAGPDSSGQTGTVAVRAREALSLSNEATISITNRASAADPASISPTLVTVSAPVIDLANGAQITAESFGNVAASNVDVTFGANLTLRRAAIATSAQDGNGGAIAVRGTGVLTLQDSQITTSVAGAQGNGGDIDLAAPIMVMQTGFVQANTAAAAASGGDVNVEVTSLLPSGSTLFVGGATPYTFEPGVFGFNVIQAAAPTGVSGKIVISTPVLDISGTINTLPERFLDAGGLARSPCAIVGGSSLSQVGRGGMPMSASGILRRDAVEALGAPRAANPLPSAAIATRGGELLQLTRPIGEPCGGHG